MTTVGTHPSRVDLAVHAGEPVDVTIPVLDGDTGLPVTSLNSWTVAAQVRAASGEPVLATLTAAVEGVTVRITATAAATAAWAWPSPSAQWDVVLTSPTAVPHVLCAGWVRLYPTITH